MSWDDPDVEWSSFPSIVLRTPWDVVYKPRQFVEWAQVVSRNSDLWNPASIVAWNIHKSYMLELQRAGVSIAPTTLVEAGSRADLRHLMSAMSCERAVVKPAIDSGGERLMVVDRTNPIAGQRHLDMLVATGDVLIQPFLRSVLTDGELSVVALNGKVRYAVRKRPAPNEVRIHPEYGGTVEPVEVTDDADVLTRKALDVTDAEWLFARADLLRDDHGELVVGELEMIDPDLYLRFVPEAAEIVAEAIATRASG